MARKLKVTYLDGKEAVALVTQRWIIATERHFQPRGVGEHNAIEATAFMAWVSLHKTGQEPNDYEPWLELIDDVADVDDDEATDVEPDPTQKAAKQGSASS